MDQNIYTGKVIDLTIEGDGIVKQANKTVFVAGASIGDEISFRISKNCHNYFLGKLLKIIQPSPDRAQPKCRHFSQCGGCQLQNLNYSAQLKYKENFLRQNLKKIAALADFNIPPIVPSAAEYNYRNRAQLPIGIQNKKTVLGYYKFGSQEIINQEECQIQPKEFSLIVTKIRDFCQKNKISIYNELTHQGLLRHLIIRQSYSENKILVGLVINGSKIDFTASILEEITAVNNLLTKNKIDSLVLNINTAKTNRILGERNITLWGRGFLIEKIGSKLFKLSLNTFQQINNSQAEAAYQAIARNVPPSQKIVDIFCGMGAIALQLVDKAQKIIGIEENPEAIENARENLVLNNLNNVEFVCQKADSVSGDILQNAEVIIVDPPRKGLSDKLIHKILKSAAPRIIYLSCNPATLARDIKRIIDGGYLLKSVQPFDFFPQTTHIESLAVLDKINL